MDTINSIVIAMQAIIGVGLATRIVYCCVKINTDPREAEDYKHRIKNSIQIGVIVAIISSIKLLLENYFKGG